MFILLSLIVFNLVYLILLSFYPILSCYTDIAFKVYLFSHSKCFFSVLYSKQVNIRGDGLDATCPGFTPPLTVTAGYIHQLPPQPGKGKRVKIMDGCFFSISVESGWRESIGRETESGSFYSDFGCEMLLGCCL